MIVRLVILAAALAVSALASDNSIQGDWRGTSLCQQKNTPCHDETVLFHFSAPDATNTVTIDADKIVNGKPDNMGKIIVKFDKATGTLRSDYADRIWEFHLDGRSMHGTLIFGGRLFRKLEMTKD